MVKISGGKAGSVSRLKKEMAKNSGSKTWIKNVRPDEDMTVRFLNEPDEWYAYREHYDPAVGFFPCIGRDEDCPGCNHESEKVQRASRRYLANAFDVEAGQAIPLKLPLDLANRLVARYERYGDTLTDRDYTLHRMGKGLDTTYDVTPEEKSPFDASRYQLIDIEAVLVEQFEDAFGEEEPAQKKSHVPQPSSVKPPTDEDIPSKPSRVPEPELDEELDEDDDDGNYLTEAQALEMSKADLKSLAAKLAVDIDGRWSKEKIVSAIFDEAG